FDGQPITNLSTFTQGLSQASNAVPLQVTRAGQARDIQLDPSLMSDSSVRTALRPNLDADAGARATTDGQLPRTGATAPRASDENSPIAAPPADSRAPGAPAPGAPRATPARRLPHPHPRRRPPPPPPPRLQVPAAPRRRRPPLRRRRERREQAHR